jgi:CRISPR/Cas system-associated exonuclease Cas4 (RecB family)
MRWSYFKYTIPDKENFDPAFTKSGKKAEEVAYRFLSERYRVRKCRNREVHFAEFSLAGRGDFIALGSDSYIVEVKSLRRLREKPELRWLAQLNLYLFMENFENGILLEVSENAIRMTKMRFSRKLLWKSLLYFSKLRLHVVRREVPKATWNRRCRYCSYRHVCYERSIERRDSIERRIPKR